MVCACTVGSLCRLQVERLSLLPFVSEIYHQYCSKPAATAEFRRSSRTSSRVAEHMMPDGATRGAPQRGFPRLERY